MRIHVAAEALRIYIGEDDRADGRPLYEALVEAARRRGMAGATVTRGLLGFGANSLVHTAKILRLSEDLPLVVEIIDIPERIAAFLPVVEDMVREGTVTRQTVSATFNCPMRVREVMTANVVTVAPDAPLSEVLTLLLDRGVKAVPVVEDRRVVGMITGGDLLLRAGMGLRLSLNGDLPGEMRNDAARRLDVAGKTARDVMSGPVVTVNIRARVPEAATLMAERKLKRLPVVDDAGELVGILSRVDILKTMATAATVAGFLPPQLPGGLARTAADVMLRDVPTIGPEAPLQQALDKLVASPLRRVVVTDANDRVLGIVLDRELIRRFARQEKPGLLRLLAGILGPGGGSGAVEGVAVREAMRADVFTVRETTPLSEVLRRMVDAGVKRLVVVDAADRLRGMVDRDAILRIIGEAR